MRANSFKWIRVAYSAIVLPLNHISYWHLMTESSVSSYLNTLSMILIVICVNAHSFKCL